jgi:protein TonB
MELKKNPDIAVARNSSIYFAVGINLMLLCTLYGFEYKTYDNQDKTLDVIQIDQELEEDIPITNLTAPPPPPVQPAAPEIITVVEDNEEVEETVIESTETNQNEKIEDVVEVNDVFVEEVEEEIEVPFAIVESVPIYPGCTGNRNQLKKCFNDMVLKHVKKTFKYPVRAQEMGIQGKVFVMFIVDTEGNISKIRTRGPDVALEEEAKRIISSLPKMTAGRQRDKPVNVPYAIPISFKLE